MTTLAFDVLWRDRGAAKGLQGLGRDAKTSGEHLERVRSIGPRLGAAFGAFVGLDVLGGFIKDARESAMIGRVTAQVIQSTGGAAHVTAAQVGDLATEISNKTGADDEAIQSGQNMLLTFTNVRNEVGRGNDIFNQASAATVDLAAAMNHGEVTADGMKTSSIQLGKALNDPIKGVTALQKVGVTFTAQQREQIKTMVQSGNVLGAQKIILGELNKEFGGTAKAAADPMQRLSVVIGNLGEQIGGALLPAIDSFATFMAETGAPAISTFVSGLQQVPTGAYAAAAGIAAVIGAVKVGKSVLADVQAVTRTVGDAMRWMGLRTVEAAAAEQLQTGAAEKQVVANDAAAVSTSRLGTAVGTLAGKAALAAGVAGLGLLFDQVTSWSGTSDVAKVKTDDLASALLDYARTGKIAGAAQDVLNNNSSRLWGTVDTGTEALHKFRDEAVGAFSHDWTDVVGRLQTGGERVARFTATAQQMDAALANMASNGHVNEATKLYLDFVDATGLEGEELQHVLARFPQLNAVLATNANATARTAGQGRDEGGALRYVASGAGKATGAIDANTGATGRNAGKTLTAKQALDQWRTSMTKATKGFLDGQAAGDNYQAALDDVTSSIRTNGRSLDSTSEKGRANRSVLRALVTAGQDVIDNLVSQNASGRRIRAEWQRQRDKLYDVMLQITHNDRAARTYVDKALGKIPPTVTTTFRTPGAVAAKRAAEQVRTAIHSIDGRVITIRYRSDGSVVLNGRVARAGGGAIPGWSPSKTADNIPVAATAGEHMWSVDEVRGAGGHGKVEQLRAAARSGALRLAAGGAVRTDYVGSFNSTVVPNYVMGLVRHAIASGVGPVFGGGGTGGPGGSGVQRWASVILRALSMLHQSPSWLNTVERRMQRESGGNPRAINLWDTNAQHGDPSRGLMQTIMSTFLAYAGPLRGRGIYDPLANVYAGLNYALHRYGSLSALNRAGGYDRGGLARGAGLLAKGPQPERMLSPAQTAIFERAMTSAAAGTSGAVTYHVEVHLPNYLGREDTVLEAMDRWSRTGRMTKIVRQAA